MNEMEELIEVKELDAYYLREKLKQKELELLHLHEHFQRITQENPRSDIERYCRQMILPDVGVQGQLNLKKSSVLIVGTGGIGCPVAQYLAAAGVGQLGLVDYDKVEVSNLHRQILHSEVTVGVPKVDSAAEALRRLNMNVKIERYNTLLDSSNIMEIIKPYDIVVDATDNVPTRYLLNDACFLAGRKPLVSGSALQMEGQLTVYGGVWNEEAGDGRNPPCYRCLFPKPPPPETVSNCSDNGVLGVVPGLIGVLQALEVIKIILKKRDKRGTCSSSASSLSGKLLLFDAAECAFRTVNLRYADPNCALCGTNPKITTLQGMDYENLCGAGGVKLLDKDERISAPQYYEVMRQKSPHVLIDVRSEAEFNMCSLPTAVNLPMEKVSKGAEVVKKAISESVKDDSTKLPVYVVCRRGNDSQKAVIKLREVLGEEWEVKDVIGGLHAWSEDVDKSFPHY
ncbi:hypothetical protein J437_LFUL007012 [Ladona fulva]|uniref:Adenylyltransferase and sulfurtransferase MOCS3 homolog n=1 Tax=Ladona fulva TaxID=123851 RepID=A0A8K0K4N0_LADFU|nr:hypothetical protein J437_LFUL007012 [Ladona fulva]